MSNICPHRAAICAKNGADFRRAFCALDFFMRLWYHSAMGKVTDIKPQKRSKSRVNVYIDGEFAVALEAVTAKAGGVIVGAEIDADALARLCRESEDESALSRAFGYISRRMRTESEVRKYLTERKYPPSAVDSAVAKLKEYGYIDDEEFVRSYVENKRDTRGKLRMRRDLALCGADEKLIDGAIGDMGDQREAASRAAEKYLRTHPYDYRKLCARLSSMGFEWEDVRAAVRGLGKETEDEESI